jgi:hypothetical protein
MDLQALQQLNALLLRRDGTPRPAFWGPIALVALLVIGFAAL